MWRMELHPALSRFQSHAPHCNVARGSGIVTVNSSSGSTLQCDTWLWDHDIEFTIVFHLTISVSGTVYDIFGVKEWRDLENWVKGSSRSLKMAPFGRPYDFILYRFLSYLTLNNIVALESGLKVTRGHLNHSKAWVLLPIRLQ